MLATHEVESHYGHGNVLVSIVESLRSMGKETANVTVDDLAPVDEFHSRGRASTVELTELCPIHASDRVLDVGCGLGGSARFIADKRGCTVFGIDLTQEYIDAAQAMTEWVGMTNQVSFAQASALELPFVDDSFEVVWTEHAQMNIVDKKAFYGEIQRVLKPGGHLLFHDIFGGNQQPTYPLPWAENASISALATESEARQIIESSGLRIVEWQSKIDKSIEAFTKLLENISKNGPPPLGIHLLMGNNAGLKIENYVSSMKTGAITVAMGVCQNPDSRP